MNTATDPSSTTKLGREDDIAVRVDHVSKTYGIWSSPNARLAHPLLNLAAQILPFSRLTRSLEHRTRHMYRDFHALHDISLEIKKGESWGFIGVNGSGKSTLLKIISGNLRPSSGTVEVDGKVAILDYGAGFNGEFTGRENIYLKASILGLTRRQIDERFDNIAAFADIGDFIEQPVKTYSSGMAARLGFAIMAHVNADIIITDEALAVGDAFFVQKCMRHVHTFLKQGTFLFVSHSINDVLTLCSHAVWLEHGRVLRVGESKVVCAAYMSSIARESSEVSLEGVITEESNHQQSEQNNPNLTDTYTIRERSKSISLTMNELALLKKHYAPKAGYVTPSHEIQIEVREPQLSTTNAIWSEAAVGGGKIFSVTMTNENNLALPYLMGGETVNLTIRIIAEKPIKRPLVGFQLKNHLGLALIGENTDKITQSNEFSMYPREVVSVVFSFSLPLLPAGQYVLGAAFYDGYEGNGAAIDVLHEALLLNCQTSGDRHGLVGVPMLRIDIIREEQS